MVPPLLVPTPFVQAAGLMSQIVPCGPVTVEPTRASCSAMVVTAGAHGIRSQQGVGKMPTVAQAAKARKSRVRSALRRDPTFASGANDFVGHGKLCREGRACVWSWARGQISGARCLLELEQCKTVLNLLNKDFRSEAEEEEDALGVEAALWMTGCVRLGGMDQRLKTLRRDLETKSPDKVLQDAWEAVEREAGATADCLEVEEVAAALRRLSERAARRAWDPGAFIRVQVWRELICMHMGGQEADSSEENASRSTPRIGSFQDVDDKSVLGWIQMTEQDLMQAVEDCTPERLARNAELLLGYAEQVLRMGGRLKKALEFWQRFDAYRVLGVSRHATLAEIRKAFYKKALIMHPDKGGDKAAFQELQRAYDDIMEERKNVKISEEEATEASDSGEPDSPKPAPKPKEEPAQPAPECTPPGADAENNQQPTEEANQETEWHDSQMESGQDGAPAGGTLRQAANHVSAAAAWAGEVAVEVLRYCYAAMDCLEEEPADIIQACSSFNSALQAAPRVRETVKTVEEQVPVMSGLLAARALAEANLDSADDSGSDASHNDAIEQALANASMALTEAVTSYTSTLAEASAVFEDLGNCQGDSKYMTESFHDVCTSVVRAVKDLAMAALDAAVVMSDIASNLEIRCPVDADSLDEDMKNLQVDVRPESHTPGHERVTEETVKQPVEEDEADDEDNCSETQESVRTILEAIHMLRVTNLQVLRLQREAHGLSCKDPQSMPEVSLERRQRCFQLVAELLDEAALNFHEQLNAVAVANPTQFMSELGIHAVQAAARGFKFLLRSSPALAVPLDATAQALRAAVALDHAAVRTMLQEQVLPRLEVSLQGAHLTARCQGMEADLPSPRTVDEDMQDVLESLQCTFLEALDGLQAGLAANADMDAC